MPLLDMKDAEGVRLYNEFVASFPGANITQTTYWSSLKEGWQQQAIYLQKDEKITAAMLLLIKKMPLLPCTLIYCPKGPVWDFSDSASFHALLLEAMEVAKKHNAFMLRFDPELPADFPWKHSLAVPGIDMRCIAKDLKDYIQPKHNMVLCLEGKSEAQVFESFSSKTRYNINLSLRKGVQVQYDNSCEVARLFYDLYKVTAERDGFTARNLDYFENMLSTLPKECVRIYFARHEEDILSAAIAVNFGGKMWYMYGASSNCKRNLMPNYAMQWDMIRWAVSLGCKKYDFGGVFVFDKENGLYKFKEGFCREDGMTEYIGEIDIVRNRFLYFAFEKLLPALQKCKRRLAKRK